MEAETFSGGKILPSLHAPNDVLLCIKDRYDYPFVSVYERILIICAMPFRVTYVRAQQEIYTIFFFHI